MRARVEASFQCDINLLSSTGKPGVACVERAPGYIVMTMGPVPAALSEVSVFQPMQVSVRNPAWAVLSRQGSTYMLCPKHAAEGRRILDGSK